MRISNNKTNLRDVTEGQQQQTQRKKKKKHIQQS